MRKTLKGFADDDCLDVSAVTISAFNSPKMLIVHHSGGTDAQPNLDTSNTTFDAINNWHKIAFNYKSSLGYYIGYHEFCDKKGVRKTGRADLDLGAHTIGYNDKSLAFCFAGNFDVTLATDAQKKAFKAWALEKMIKWNIPVSEIYPHRKFAVKTCYGKLHPDTFARDLAKEALKEEIGKLVDAADEATSRLKKLILLFNV